MKKSTIRPTKTTTPAKKKVTIPLDCPVPLEKAARMLYDPLKIRPIYDAQALAMFAHEKLCEAVNRGELETSSGEPVWVPGIIACATWRAILAVTATWKGRLTPDNPALAELTGKAPATKSGPSKYDECLCMLNAVEWNALEAVCKALEPIMGNGIAGKAKLSPVAARQRPIPRLMKLKLIQHPKGKQRTYVPCPGVREAVVTHPRYRG